MNTRMKLTSLSLLVLVSLSGVALFFGCETERKKYEGPVLVQFSDTVKVFAVVDSEEKHTVLVSSTEQVNYDRSFGVEVIGNKGDAIEGYHYAIENPTVTIKAGQRVGKLELYGYVDKLDKKELYLSLALVNAGDDFGQAGHRMKVGLKKVCRFDLQEFVGYCVIESSFLGNKRMRVASIVADPEHTNGLIIKDYIQDGYDLQVVLNTENPLEAIVEMEADQIVGKGSDFLGGIYGDNDLRIAPDIKKISYYDVCDKSMVQEIMFYIKDVGLVGNYSMTISCITDAEAAYLKENGY